MPTVSDLESAYYAQYGYTGSITDMQYQYYSNPPTLDAYGFVRISSPPATALISAVANTTYYYRVIEGGTYSVVRIGIGLQSGNICLAAYKNTGTGLNAKPGNRTATTGSIACPAAAIGSYVDVPMGSSVTVAAGDWLSLSADNNTATFIGTNAAGPWPAGSQGNFTVEVVFPAPATAGGTLTGNNGRMIAMIGIP